MTGEESYDRVTRQAMNSRFAHGSAEIVASKLAGILDDLKEQP